LNYIMHYIPPKFYMFLFHNQCFKFHLQQIMLFLEFIVFSKNM
jgi:hypothetical protein